MLVHGFLATPALMLPLERRLLRSGRAVFTPELDPLAIQDVRHLAGQLDASIDRVLHRTGADRVDLVGVSQGGIIGLWWAHHRDGWARTARMVAVGAPFRGTWAAAVGLPALALWSRGIWQLLPGAPFLDELARPLPPEARVTTLALDGDPVCPPHRCSLPGADNRVFGAPLGPLKHQWLIFSSPVAQAVTDALLDGDGDQEPSNSRQSPSTSRSWGR